MNLNELGLKYKLDKSSLLHGYLDEYERFLLPIREKELSVMEIGVLEGASLSMWKEYLPNAKFVGVDIDPKCKQYEDDRVKIIIADQANKSSMHDIGILHGKFDIIIDDGGHSMKQQINSLQVLFNYVYRGGLYVIEDLQSSFHSIGEGPGKDYRDMGSTTTKDFLQRYWVDSMLINKPDSCKVKRMTFAYGICFLEKS